MPLSCKRYNLWLDTRTASFCYISYLSKEWTIHHRKNRHRMILAIDFDGVLNASRFPSVGIAVSGAVDGMKALKAMGHTLIIWTCREGQDQTNAINWLLERGIPFDGINCNLRSNIERYHNDSRKINAHLYIDDKCIGGWQGWNAVLRYVEQLEERNEQ